MKPWLGALTLLAAVAAHAAVPQLQPPDPPRDALQLYLVDVEGGQATLFVTPDRHSLLVDTGWEGHGSRDAHRILDAMRMAHVAALDGVLLTHYHQDHAGGVPQLLALTRVGLFLDHGPNREPADLPTAEAADAYDHLIEKGKIRHQVLKPGDKLPIPGFENATVVSSDGEVLAQPLPGAGASNSFCPSQPPQPDQTENARSLGFALQWGQARVLDLGDLTRDKEQALMCPINRLGTIDLLVVSHHGWYQSSSPALVDAIAPRVAVMDNGQVKGGSIPVLDTFRDAPNKPALYQLHFSKEGGPTHNAPAPHIANLQGTAQGPDPGYLLRATVTPSGTIAIWNSRTGEQQQYARP